MKGAAALGAAALAVALAPGAASALEPRFDHRDEQGPFAEVLLAHDSVAAAGLSTARWAPALRLAYGVDLLGEGDELVVGAQLRPWRDDPDRRLVRAAVDVRYRAYFGLDEWKTFFEAGLWAPVVSRLAIGPSVGIGAQYDFSRAGGLYAGAGFATAFGEYRVASFTVSAGAQLRFE